MIVKFKVVAMYKDSWEIISEITSFRYSRITKEQALEHRKKGGLSDYIEIAVSESYVYFQAWHKRSQEPINIISNRAMYLLNDEGKTIEKIN